MQNDSPNSHDPAYAKAIAVDPDLSGTMLDFTPVPFQRNRANGWTPLTQRRFIHALSVMGSVGAAARAVGMGRVSAYRLLERAVSVGGKDHSFAAAWEKAVDLGRWRQYSLAMDRALNGVTTVRVNRGGSITVGAGPDMGLIRTALRDDPAPHRPVA